MSEHHSDLFPDAPKIGTSKPSHKVAGRTVAPAMITRLIRCQCGHAGKVRIPITRASGPFRCVICKAATA